MTILTKERAIRRMQQTPVILHALLNGVTPEKASASTDGPDGWSVLQIMCHLVDLEAIFKGRVEMALNENNPKFPGNDVNAMAIERNYAGQDFERTWQNWVVARRDFLTFLNGLTDEQWARRGIHPSMGELSVIELALNTALHDVDHIEQISRALGLSAALF